MINKFEKQLEKWNGGVLRGAQAKLAKLLRVSTATVALWTTGKRRPSKGYAAQMAQLFGMDLYDVIRLFPATTTYPDVTLPHRMRSLRDAQTPENTYSADSPFDDKTLSAVPLLSNSVSLPFLIANPEHYPHYHEDDVAEWWTIPRRHAKGAKYLIRDEESPREELYFIRPENQFVEGKMMLLKSPQGYLIKRVQIKNGKILLFTLHNEFFAEFQSSLLQPLGIVVRKITDPI